MAKIPFDIKYRPQIESGEYKVEIGKSDPWPARIACWDLNGNDLIVIVSNPEGKEEGLIYTPEGKHKAYAPRIDSYLFIVTPEEELTEFENELATVIGFGISQSVSSPEEKMMDFVKNWSERLLTLAREQFIKDGYVIAKKDFHDAVEDISDENLAEMSIQYSIHCKVKDGIRNAIMSWYTFQKVAQKFIDIGKEGVMKDLPRWKRWGNGACGNGQGRPIAIVKRGGKYKLVDSLGIQGEEYIMLCDLEKLPGFKEDSHAMSIGNWEENNE